MGPPATPHLCPHASSPGLPTLPPPIHSVFCCMDGLWEISLLSHFLLKKVQWLPRTRENARPTSDGSPFPVPAQLTQTSFLLCHCPLHWWQWFWLLCLCPGSWIKDLLVPPRKPSLGNLCSFFEFHYENNSSPHGQSTLRTSLVFRILRAIYIFIPILTNIGTNFWS